jgi:aspartate racemase
LKTIGIVGGIGPESTIDYYRYLIAEYRKNQPDGSYPAIIINSIDMKRMLDLVGVMDLPALTDYLANELQRVARAGAQIGAMASNTPHIVFDELQHRSSIPLISIVAVTCEKAKESGMSRLGLLGTRFTMQGSSYPSVFSPAGITLITPEPAEQDYIHDKYMGELVEGVILEETRQGFLKIIRDMQRRAGIEAVILGGTELPLLLKEGGGELPFLDTTRIHIKQIIEEALRRG